MTLRIFDRANFARGFLASDLSATANQLTLMVGHSIPAGDSAKVFRLVIWDRATYPLPDDDPHVEIVTASWNSGNTYDLARAQEGTAAATHAAACKVGLHYTAGISNGDIDFLRGKQAFLTSGTFIAPFGVSLIYLNGSGGGAGGGGGGGGALNSAGGGGSAAEAALWLPYAVIGGNSYLITIGQSGPGGPGGGAPLDGTNGEDSIFDTLVFRGGKAGRSGSLGVGGASVGGFDAVGQLSGGFALKSGAGASRSSGRGGGGGGSPFGPGGRGGNNGVDDATAGQGFGSGGGGGGGSGNDGKAGAPGIIIVMW